MCELTLCGAHMCVCKFFVWCVCVMSAGADASTVQLDVVLV